MAVAIWGPLPPLDPNRKFGSGGVGAVYRDVRNPTQCIKKFFKPVVGDKARQLAHLIDVASWARPSEQHVLETRFGWPLIGYGSPDRIEGFSMTYAPDDAQFIVQVAGKTKKLLLQSKYVMDDRFWVKNKALTSTRPHLDDQDRVSVAIEFLDAIEILHRHDLVYGDVSGNNICVRVGDYKSVFFLDADSIVSPDLRLQNPVRTPDWELTDGLDPVSADRALAALFIWRILAEHPKARPSIKEARSLPGVVGTNCGVLLAELYETGSQAAVTELRSAIRACRSKDRADLSYSRALKTGFARFLVGEALPTMSETQREMVSKAERFVQLEVEIEHSAGPRQRRLIKKLGTLDYPFVFDLSNVAVMGSPPTTVDDVLRMMRDAEFIEVAQHLATSGLGALESHWSVTRALKHAYGQVDPAALSARAKAEHGVISWRWPSLRFINVVQLDFLQEGVSILVDEVHRDFSQASTERSLSVPGGGEVTAVLRFGTQSPSGQTFWAQEVTRVKFAVPPQPVMAMTRAAPMQAALFDPQTVQLQSQFDADLSLLAAQNRDRVRRRRLQVSFGGVLTAAAAACLFLLWPVGGTTDRCRMPSLTNVIACAVNRGGAIDVADRFGP